MSCRARSAGGALTEAAAAAAAVDGADGVWHPDFIEFRDITKISGFLAKLNQLFAKTYAGAGLKWAHFSIVWASQNSLTVTQTMSDQDKATAQKYNTYKLFTSWLDTFIRRVTGNKWSVKDVMECTIPGLTPTQKQLILNKSMAHLQNAMTNT
ncbi:hypothetical protein GPECTOR_182g261 [Gonium pectorale]|uniref:Uncharacterized protein n=1 Tax=Gonium pectorale TaxID=33097 RepID=A0A150FX77_GONPE|nr:hypothetical protein GPECTOR_182g261 [Gonium pectorale]|eukprot:KXZ42206.1 hypothetical protein GPECTOR_182g261 [Gonium pectorale]